ncbi:MAG: hypothetical protein AAGA83_27310, partial [Cyanobacteria bacterium P01_F01_bin.116]
MRVFNEREKEILKILVQQKNTDDASLDAVLQDVIFTKERGLAPIISTENKAIYLFIKNISGTPKEVKENILSRMREFLEITYLIRYLKDKGAIMYFPGV